MVKIDLSKVECMIALPFHPSIAYTIHELQADPEGILAKVEEACNKQLGGKVTMDLRRNIVDGKVTCDQGVIVGCSGGMYENIVEAAAILKGQSIGNGYFDMSVYPSSTPISLAITKNGTAATLMEAGCVMKPAFCGPCFGAGDTPANNTLSIRHATRNFANREGSKPGNGQIAAVALMDARSIAATARNGGVLTAATDIDYESPTAEELTYHFDGSVYDKRCYEGFGKADPDGGAPLRPQHQGLAQDAQAGGGPAGEAVRRDPRPRHHHRRADPLRRDQLLPLQPHRPQRVRPQPPGAGVCGPVQGGPRPGGGPGGR